MVDLLSFEEFESFSDKITDGILLSHIEDGGIISANQTIADITGYNKTRIQGLDWIEFIEKIGLEEFAQEMQDRENPTTEFQSSVALENKFAEIIDLNISVLPVETKTDRLHLTLFSSTRDATLIGRLNNIIQMILTTHDEVDYIDDIQVFAQKVCNNIIDIANEDFAWLGTIDFESLEYIQPIASAGKIEGIFEGLDELDISQSRIKTVLQYGESLIIKDIDEEEDESVWTLLAEELDLKSILLIPLEHDQVVFGILSIFSEKVAAYPSIIAEHYQNFAFEISDELINYLFEDEVVDEIEQDQINKIIHEVNNFLTTIIGYTTKIESSEDISKIDEIEEEILGFSEHLKNLQEETRKLKIKEEVEVEVEEKLIQGSQETVVIVDDDHGSRQLIKEILQSNDYGILMAADGKQALEIIEKNKEKVDLVIIDIMMPEISGIELSGKIQEQFGDGIKKIFISGYQITPMVQNQLEESKTPFLSKPFEPENLLNTVKKQLE